jgi:hypothetical protein
MSGSPLKKFVFTPVLLSAAVFATLSLPLAILGKQQIRIQMQSEPLYEGQLRDVATPYLALATVISLGAGVASVALTGWRTSTRKSSEVEAQLSTLVQSLQEREAQLESLKLSPERLDASGLSAFVDEELPNKQLPDKQLSDKQLPDKQLPDKQLPDKQLSDKQLPDKQKLEEKLPHESTLETPAPSLKEVPIKEVEPLVITEQPFTVPPQIVVTNSQTVQATAAKFASAQIFLGYTQRKDTVNSVPNTPEIATAEVDKLYTQLQEIKAQMASMQQLISSTKSTVTYSEPTLPTQPHLQIIKSWSVNDAAS